MSVVGRLAGALLASSGREWWLVGDLKQPCDFVAAGFEPPGEIDVSVAKYRRLQPTREIAVDGERITLEVEGEALAKLLAERMLIERNGSVSDRLWRAVLSGGEQARWLGEMPL